MLHLNLDADERDVLTRLLERALGDLRMEIAATENYEFRQDLKAQEEVIKKLLVALRQVMPTVQA